VIAKSTIAADDFQPTCLEISEVAPFSNAALADGDHRAPGALLIGLGRAVPEQGRSGERGKDKQDFSHDRPLQSETSHHVNTGMPFFIHNIGRPRFILAQACGKAVRSEGA
jgi:hypothetical protein